MRDLEKLDKIINAVTEMFSNEYERKWIQVSLLQSHREENLIEMDIEIKVIVIMTYAQLFELLEICAKYDVMMFLIGNRLIIHD